MGVSVGVNVDVAVGQGPSQGVGVGVSSAPASLGETENSAAARASAAAMVTASGHIPCGRLGTSLLLLSKVRVIIGSKEYVQQFSISLIVALLDDRLVLPA